MNNPYTIRDCGCYCDSARGRYAIDKIVSFSEAHGFKHDAVTTPTGSPGDFSTYADYEYVDELENECDNCMNEHYGVDGAYWGRNENGDWGLWETEGGE